MNEAQAKAADMPKWYHWHRFALLPKLSTRKADRYNTWNFSFHWLVFRAWSMDSITIGFSFELNDQNIQIRLVFPYLITGLFIPVFPESMMQKFWRRVRASQ